VTTAANRLLKEGGQFGLVAACAAGGIVSIRIITFHFINDTNKNKQYDSNSFSPSRAMV